MMMLQQQKEQRKAMPVAKGPAGAVTRGGLSRIQSRRERKLALQQDVREFRLSLLEFEDPFR
jgi:hypothetical protein